MRIKSTYIIRFLPVCMAILFTLSCSQKKNTFISRSYHNLTAHYNAYFNGREAFKQGNKKVASAIRDNFTLILPVYVFSDPTAANASSSDMETALEKASKVIKLHSIKEKPKRKSGKLSKKKKAFYEKTEYCNWVDDSYLLMGKAHFYKHDFYSAEEAFEYVIKEFSSEDIKFDASIWLARTYSQMGKYTDAKNLLERIEGDGRFPKRLKKDLSTSFADLYLKQKKYKDAIPWLEVAVEKTRKKQEKARYLYILAQIYQQNGQFNDAANAFDQVIKCNPTYEMVFNALINRATSFDMASGRPDQIRKQLNKMLKDDKNIDFRDQIYFAIANIYLKEGKEKEAIDNFKLSVLSSINNSIQKAMSYLAMADIFFNKKDYIPAQAYYDSSLAFIDEQYPKYTEILIRSKTLNNLVENINIVKNEDSLQYVASLSEKEQFKIIDEIIQNLKDEEARQKQEEQQQQINSMIFQQNQANQNLNTGTSGGKWYFYNPATLGFGMSEFKRKWGNRKLEDDWRRKNKSIVVQNGDEDELNADTVIDKFMDDKSREYYLKNLPVNDSLKLISNKRIEDALFKIGELYMNTLKDPPLAVQAFEDLIKRYPSTKYKLSTYYDLYKLYKSGSDEPKADYYKNLIIREFPESNYAQMLSNPNYLQELEAQRAVINELYNKTYKAFRRQSYNQVFTFCASADSLYKNNYLKAKFDLLNALATGGSGDFDGFKTSLSNIIEKYPGSEEKTSAENILGYIEKGDYSYLAFLKPGDKEKIPENLTTETPKDTTTQSTAVVQNTVKPEDELFSIDDDSLFYFAMLVTNQNDPNLLKYNVFSFNIDRFVMFDFDVRYKRIDESYSLLLISPLTSQSQAEKYYKSVHRHKPEIVRNIKNPDIQDFIISSKNLSTIKNIGDIQNYQEFFERRFDKL